MRILAGLMTAGALAMAGAAWAAPPGVTEKDGAFVAPDGKPLYTFARDTEANKSTCVDKCLAAFFVLRRRERLPKAAVSAGAGYNHVD